jgi:virulence-associated protein VapD
LDQEELKRAYPGTSYVNAYAQIKTTLGRHGFTPQQGSLYFGDPQTVNAVSTVLAIQELAQTYAWFNARVVSDIRMLRIEDNNDLMPAINAVASSGPQAAAS